MSYYRHINNGEGPVKLIIGGIHGNEGQTTINLVKLLKKTSRENYANYQAFFTYHNSLSIMIIYYVRKMVICCFLSHNITYLQ